MGLMTPQEILSSVELWLLVALPCLNLTVPEFHWGLSYRFWGSWGSWESWGSKSRTSAKPFVVYTGLPLPLSLAGVGRF